MTHRLKNLRIYLLMCILFMTYSLRTLAHPSSRISRTDGEQNSDQRDRQHDFDFTLGTWKTHIKARDSRTNSKELIELDGTMTVSKIWNGRASLEEIEIDGPAGHIEALTVRLYRPESRQWYLHCATASDGTLSQPMVGEFKNGIGEFYKSETSEGRPIFVRQMFSEITSDSYHFEQAFSNDGGRTWEPNWKATVTRVLVAQTSQSRAGTDDENRKRDFDFNFGTWKTHVSRLMQPLTGSKKWVEYDGTSVVRRVWNGRASLFELDVEGAAGHIEGMGLRLHNPQSDQWNLNWANRGDGVMNQPMRGEFKNGSGAFFDQEQFNGRAIFVRNGFFDITPQSSRFEQAFSADGGKTWETNWIMTFTRPED